MIMSITVYELYHNLDSHFGRAGTVEDRYLYGHRWYVEDTDTEGWPMAAEDVAERIYAKHQRDDRPDRDERPSLSVGDVIVMERFMAEDFGTMVLVYTVDVLGFQTLGHKPSNVLYGYPEDYFEERR